MNKLSIEKLFDYWVHLGDQIYNWNPKMINYLFGSRNKYHIIDINQTIILLQKVEHFIKEIINNNGTILFIDTWEETKKIVNIGAKKCHQPYVSHRWIGGTFTNWNNLYKSIKKLWNLEKKWEENKITHQERKRYSRLKLFYEGLIHMDHLPDAVFLLNTNKYMSVIKECIKSNIPVISIINSNSNPDGITYPIPGNSNSINCINLYIDCISSLILNHINNREIEN